MKVLVALAAGYVLGARTAGEELDDVLRSMRALRDSEEFHDLLTAVRSHAAHSLRELATMLDRPLGEGPEGEAAAGGGLRMTDDLVARVRDLAGLR
jgi:hypothetical protein